MLLANSSWPLENKHRVTVDFVPRIQTQQHWENTPVHHEAKQLTYPLLQGIPVSMMVTEASKDHPQGTLANRSAMPDYMPVKPANILGMLVRAQAT